MHIHVSNICTYVYVYSDIHTPLALKLLLLLLLLCFDRWQNARLHTLKCLYTLSYARHKDTILNVKKTPRKASKKDNFNVKKPTSTYERKWKKRTQRHSNGTKAQGFEIIVGKMHGWTYGEILIYCFSDKGHRGITAKCTLYYVFPSSHASRWDAHSGDGTCFAICVFLEGKAQRHNDTKGQTSDFGRWHNLCFNRGQGTEAEGKRIWLQALAECMVGHTLKSLYIYTDFLTKSTKA